MTLADDMRAEITSQFGDTAKDVYAAPQPTHDATVLVVRTSHMRGHHAYLTVAVTITGLEEVENPEGSPERAALVASRVADALRLTNEIAGTAA